MRIFKKTLTAVLVGSLTIPAGTLVPVTKAYAQSSEQPATEKPVSENTADLAALTGASERQTARLITTVRRSPEPAFAADTETGKPVWASLKELNGAAAELANAAALKDDSFQN